MELDKFRNLVDEINTLTEVEKHYLSSILKSDCVLSNEEYNDNITIGEEIIINHDIYGDIPFIVIGKNHDASNSVTLLSKEILRLLAFDARELENPDNNIKEFGNNRYRYSNLLQWMNSDKCACYWFNPEHKYDLSPSNEIYINNEVISDNSKPKYNLSPKYTKEVVSSNPYHGIDGLLKGFSTDIVNNMITVDKITALNVSDINITNNSEVVSSKVFLLSRTEVGLGNENNVAEGKIYEYFNTDGANKRKAYSSIYCLNNAGGYTDTNFACGKPWLWWLRTPNSGNSYAVRIVYLDGSLFGYSAYGGNWGVRFAFCLPIDYFLSLKGGIK